MGTPMDVAMSLSRVPAQASVEAPRKARLTRRATMAVSAAMAGKRSAAEAACVAQQVDGPAAAGRGRAGGASMALMPDPASEPDGDCPGPGLSKRQKRRKTTASRLAGCLSRMRTPGPQLMQSSQRLLWTQLWSRTLRRVVLAQAYKRRRQQLRLQRLLPRAASAMACRAKQQPRTRQVA